MLIEIDKKDIGRYAIKDIMVANDRYGSWVSLESMIGEDHIHLMVNEEVEVSVMPEADAILRYGPETKMYSRMPKINTTLVGSVTPPDDKTKEYISEIDGVTSRTPADTVPLCFGGKMKNEREGEEE